MIVDLYEFFLCVHLITHPTRGRKWDGEELVSSSKKEVHLTILAGIK